MRTFAISLLSAFLSVTPVVLAQQGGYHQSNGPDETQQVSLIQLIANPQAYDHKVVRFIGYLHLEFEGNAIYFHREDFEHSIYEISIWIDLPKGFSQAQIKAVNDQYVICTALYSASKHGHMGLFSGELEDVKRLEKWR